MPRTRYEQPGPDLLSFLEAPQALATPARPDADYSALDHWVDASGAGYADAHAALEAGYTDPLDMSPDDDSPTNVRPQFVDISDFYPQGSYFEDAVPITDKFIHVSATVLALQALGKASRNNTLDRDKVQDRLHARYRDRTEEVVAAGTAKIDEYLAGARNAIITSYGYNRPAGEAARWVAQRFIEENQGPAHAADRRREVARLRRIAKKSGFVVS